MAEDIISREHQNPAHQERLLQTYYDRLKEIDENNRSLTNFFFGVDTAILALVLQVFRDSWQGVVLAAVGYFASVALVLIGYKSYWSWRAYYHEVRRLEHVLHYDISEQYEHQLHASPARMVRITSIRLRFNFLFLVLLAALVAYLIFTIPSPWSISPLISTILGGIIIVIIICLPWAYLLSSFKPAVLKAVLRAPWAREV